MNKEPECLQWLMNTGRWLVDTDTRPPAPKTCEICGLGPCRMLIKMSCDGKPTTYTAPSNNKLEALEAIKTLLKYIEESSK